MCTTSTTTSRACAPSAITGSRTVSTDGGLVSWPDDQGLFDSVNSPDHAWLRIAAPHPRLRAAQRRAGGPVRAWEPEKVRGSRQPPAEREHLAGHETDRE